VYESITRFEGLLKSETLSDPENITELLMSYDEAFKVLKSAYREALKSGAALPPLETVVSIGRSRSLRRFPTRRGKIEGEATV
jgi:hypothetical protein